MKTAIYLLLFAMFTVGACADKNEIIPEENVNITPVVTLSDQEKADLLFLVEEEKLARDVYRYAQKQYNINVFVNIPNSEQTHMEAIGALLTTYVIANPTDGKAEGVFLNKDLQALYTQLTAKVDLSLVDALTVGATIEDLDIFDIDRLLAETEKADLVAVYENLRCGSTNHMRGFVGQLKSNNADYTPQYIDLATFNEIMNGSHQHCGG